MHSGSNQQDHQDISSPRAKDKEDEEQQQLCEQQAKTGGQHPSIDAGVTEEFSIPPKFVVLQRTPRKGSDDNEIANDDDREDDDGAGHSVQPHHNKPPEGGGGQLRGGGVHLGNRLVTFVDNVRVGYGVSVWVLQLLWRFVVATWVIVFVCPFTWVVYGVWRVDDDRSSGGGGSIEGNNVGSSSRRYVSPIPVVDDEIADGVSPIAPYVDGPAAFSGKSYFPPTSSFRELDAAGESATGQLTVAEMSRASRLRRELNERLRKQSSTFCTPQTLRVHIATWNVAQQQPPPPVAEGGSSLRRWVLGDALTEALEVAEANSTTVPLDQFPDVLVVGLQEVEFGGIALMVETTESSVAWTEAVTDCINDAVQWRVRFKKLRTVQLVGIVLIVVVRSHHEPFVAHVRTSLARTGAMSGVMGNKGSIALRMTLYGKRFLFVCAHFHPHLNNAATRMKNYHSALSEMKFELSRDADDEFDVVRSYDEVFQRAAQRRQGARGVGGGGDGPGSATTRRSRTQGQSAWSRFFSMRSRRDDAVLKELKVLESHDYVFFFGDLNYRLHGLKGDDIRLKLPEEANTKGGGAASSASPSSSVHLWEQEYQSTVDNMIRDHDELSMGMRSQKIFNGFEESRLSFPPTYKYDMGTNRYDSSSKKRDPAWTDRILYRVWDDAHPISDLVLASFGGGGAASDEEDSNNNGAAVQQRRATSLPEAIRNRARKVFSSKSLLRGLGSATPEKSTTQQRRDDDGDAKGRSPVASATDLRCASTPLVTDLVSSCSPSPQMSQVPSLLQLFINEEESTPIAAAAAAAPVDDVDDGGTSSRTRAAAASFTAATMLSAAQQQQQSLSGGVSDDGGSGSTSQYPPTGLARPAPFGAVVPNRLRPCGYHSIQSLTLSDHKPVLASFEVSVVGINEKQSQAAMSSCRDLWDEGHCDVDAHLN